MVAPFAQTLGSDQMNIYRRIASDISPNVADRRYSSRQPVNVDAHLITPSGNVVHATVRDVSSRGFRVKATYGVTIGRSLVLAIPGLPKYLGWVAWSYLGEFGLEAAQEISEHAIERIIALNVPVHPPPQDGE
ncbi:PilZ domain-containing protein [Sphingomonas sp. PP-CC-3A-396]|uniref:PilZ domain-containing protein n=1 Tax=Sphingomonas sp. PP-CC-3A-396 TaxID=2135655 RepID=UPI00140533AF|nr:PilZ domain-containing protein [Sphingomonas sp. PP-CC-3A-396]